MNGAMRRLTLLALLAASVGGGVVARVANKTHFAARNELQQQGRLWAATAPFAKLRKGNRGIESGLFLFASRSTSSIGLGRAFGASLKSDFSDAAGSITVSASSAGLPNGLFDRQIDHTYSTAGGAASMSGLMQLRPVQKRLGAVLSVDADLNELFRFDGWHVGAVLPVVQVTNNLGLIFPTSVPAVSGTNKVASASSTIQNFFSGNYSQIGGNSQQPLLYGKATTDDRVHTAVADMKLFAAYDVVSEIDGLAQLRAGVIVPFGNRGTGEYLFDAVVGNNRHAGLLCGARGDLRLWKHKDKRMAVWVTGDLEYTLLLSASEKRTAGVYNVTSTVAATVPWGHTALGVQLNSAGTFPLANVLTQDMNVLPGSHFDATVGLSLTWNDFYINAGYNMFYRKEEVVDLANQWPIDRYGMASYDYNATVAATDFTASALSNTGYHAVGPVNNNINNPTTHLAESTVTYVVDTSVCTGPGQETHQALLGAGYHGVVKGMPFDISAIAAYEFALDTSKAINGWVLGAKVSFYL